MSRRRELNAPGWMIAVLLAAGGAGILVMAAVRASERESEREARRLVSDLAEAAGQYESTWGVYPPGDGEGSLELASYLGQPEAKRRLRRCWFPLAPREEGHYRNPVWEGKGWPRGVIHYRAPGDRNPGSVDLWCADASGRGDGINNWE